MGQRIDWSNQISVTEHRNPSLIIQIEEQGPAGAPGSGTIGVLTFTGQTSVTVDHNRGYRPIVDVSDAAGAVVDGAVDHTSLNSFTVQFNTPQSGQIAYF